MKAPRWLFRPARGGLIPKRIDQEVGISPEVTLFLCAVPSSHDNSLEALLFVFLFLRHLRIRAAMAFKVVVMFFLLTHLVCCTSPSYLGSLLTILINNDLLGKQDLPSAYSI
jgi:hypothetical protein